MADQDTPEKNLDTYQYNSPSSMNAFIEFIREWVGKSHDVSETMANSDNHGEVEYYSVTREQLPLGGYSYKFYKVMLFEYDPERMQQINVTWAFCANDRNHDGIYPKDWPLGISGWAEWYLSPAPADSEKKREAIDTANTKENNGLAPEHTAGAARAMVDKFVVSRSLPDGWTERFQGKGKKPLFINTAGESTTKRPAPRLCRKAEGQRNILKLWLATYHPTMRRRRRVNYRNSRTRNFKTKHSLEEN